MGVSIVLSALIQILASKNQASHSETPKPPEQVKELNVKLFEGQKKEAVLKLLGSPALIVGDSWLYNGELCSFTTSCSVRIKHGKIEAIFDVKPKYLKL